MNMNMTHNYLIAQSSPVSGADAEETTDNDVKEVP